MAPEKTAQPEPARLRQIYLARWDNEGGAGPDGPQGESIQGAGIAPIAQASEQPIIGAPETMDFETARLETMSAELAHLHARIIALESIVIALLAAAPNSTLGKAEAMAAMITPRAGSTLHPLTEQASQHIIDLTNRSRHFRSIDNS